MTARIVQPGFSLSITSPNLLAPKMVFPLEQSPGTQGVRFGGNLLVGSFWAESWSSLHRPTGDCISLQPNSSDSDALDSSRKPHFGGGRLKIKSSALACFQMLSDACTSHIYPLSFAQIVDGGTTPTVDGQNPALPRP